MSMPGNGGYLSMGARDEDASSARITIGAGVKVVSGILRTTLGPNGSDKLLVSSGPYGELNVTNDGATIMKNLNIQNPAAKIFTEMSTTQDNNAGDGTTSIVVLGSKLYAICEELITEKKIHPQIVVTGLSKALEVLPKILDDFTINFSSMDAKSSRSILEKMAITALSSKLVSGNKKHFAEIAVEAAIQIGNNDMNSIHIIKKDGSSMEESKLVDGFVLNTRIGMGQKKKIENPKIMVANTQLDADKIKVFGASVKVDAVSKLTEIELAERQKMIEKVSNIVRHGMDIFINRQLIYDFPEQLFTDMGVTSIEHADFEGVERLAYILDAEIASSFSKELGTENIKLGSCKLVEERTDLISGRNEPVVWFQGVPKKGACTVILRGPTDKVLDEVERSFHDALCVVYKAMRTKKYLLGGGCIDVLLSKRLKDEASKVCDMEGLDSGLLSLIFEEISKAFLEIPITLADNCGMDATLAVAQLKNAAENGKTNIGLDLVSKSVGNVEDLGILESRIVKESAIKGAFEAIMLLCRIDGIVTNRARQRPQDRRHH
ncbi:MAG: T-complex protein 1 subunit beta [Paramarteilia canceri]